MTRIDSAGSASIQLPFPTPELARLFPELNGAVDAMRVLLPIEACSERQVLERLHVRFAFGFSALPLFLQHPTTRLADILNEAIVEASTGIERMVELKGTCGMTPAWLAEWAAHCDCLESGVGDWRLCVKLIVLDRDLDVCAPETVH
jgi:hypothetical protein